MKLNIGCGPMWLEGYLNVDIEPVGALLRQMLEQEITGVPVLAAKTLQFDLRQPWPWADGSVEEILADQFLEHLDDYELNHVLQEGFRVLRSGGRLHGRTPDFARVWKACSWRSDFGFRPAAREGVYQAPWMNALRNYCYEWGHKQVWTQEMVAFRLRLVGYEAKVANDRDVDMRFEAVKP